ncbi:hypothetical protein O6H91_08G062600 [Diphasiastrum complanatum]|uniref:Uncharacterized protein n=2 Tax=Diphasiastrum complanatum TaxID=34168 RepID=A0ACC2CYF5_DIPCM|nr:hypothetical protein O6H91_08G062600 [Diphasiastrum complanatum]KAJ7546969.1 hypothetical protein O6H91_08G062600 [Diphasiastrum complanatum]
MSSFVPLIGIEFSTLMKVTAVKTAQQVLEVLRVSGTEIDLILAEVELPSKNAFKMLKRIAREEHMKHIPIVMMSAQDEMTVVVKCLRLGAADFLVKPLRVNELLNLWTHMWRRRRMLGIAERNLINGTLNVNDTPLNLLVPDTSVSNSISTDLFSENGTDKNLNIAADATSTSNGNSCQFEASHGLDMARVLSFKETQVASVSSSWKECQLFSPRKVELKAGEFSAFLAYTRVTNQSCKKLQHFLPNGIKEIDQYVNAHRNQPVIEQNPSGAEGQHYNLKCPRDVLLGAEKKDRTKQGGLPFVEAGESFLCVQKKQKTCEGLTGHSRLNNDARDCPTAVEIDRLDSSRQSSTQMVSNAMEKVTSAHGQLVTEMGAENAHLAGVPFLPTFPSSHLMLPGFIPSLQHTPALVPSALPFYHAIPNDKINTTALGPPLHSFPPLHELPAPYYLPLPGQFVHHPIWPMPTSTPIPQSSTVLADRRKAALSKLRKKRKER